MTAVDPFSKYLFVRGIKDKTAGQVTDALMLEFLGMFGAPKEIVLDNGRE